MEYSLPVSPFRDFETSQFLLQNFLKVSKEKSQTHQKFQRQLNTGKFTQRDMMAMSR
jgi:hypothetical protein